MIRGNTVTFTSGGNGAVAVYASPGVLIHHNIVADNAGTGVSYGQGTPAPGVIACNDVWGNTRNYYTNDLTGLDGNTSVDPLFCDVASRSLGLEVASPCAPAQNDCGLVGARDVSCGVVGVPNETAIAGALELLAPWPHPISRSARVAFVLPRAGAARLEIYDPAGRRLATLADRAFGAGRHEVNWPESGAGARALEPGVYFIVLHSGGSEQVRRAVVVR